MNEVADRLKIDPELIQPGVDGLLSAGMVEERRRGAECDLYLTATGTLALEKLTEARRSGLTELLEGWNPEEHPEVIEMVKHLAHSLLADDERMVADAMPHAGATAGAVGAVRRLTSASAATVRSWRLPPRPRRVLLGRRRGRSPAPRSHRARSVPHRAREGRRGG